MKIKALVILFLAFHGVLFSQEICTNGVDDDGDNLIDLNDPDCECLGIPIQLDVTSIIPNPDFEEMICCPTADSEFDCSVAWASGTGGSADFMHTCNFIPWAIQSAGLVPFPSGDGATGGYVGGNKEYPAVCLNSPFEQGETYFLTFDIAAVVVHPTCPITPSDLPPTWLTLYGSSGCDFTVMTADCPEGLNDWHVIGTVLYQPIDQWQEITMTFSPTFDVNGIMIGAACSMPQYYDNTCYPYFGYDDFHVEQDNVLLQVELQENGLPCQLDYSLLGLIDHVGGEWQWFFNGVAMNGQTTDIFFLEDNQYQSGTYQVMYYTPEGCSVDSIQVNIPPRDTTHNTHFICPGESTTCGGMYYDQAGEDYIVLSTPDGCDSIVHCLVQMHDPYPPTLVEMSACAPFSTTICGQTFNTTGYYTITCTDSRGCDSIVNLDLQIMNPEAMLAFPDTLICDSMASVILDGTGSSTNPLPGGMTSYTWLGPFGGLAGTQDSTVEHALKPGAYCLILHFENQGQTCLDTACVDVIGDFNLPAPPQISGSSIGCTGDTIYITRAINGADSLLTFEWILQDSLATDSIDLHQLSFVPSAAGIYQFCSRSLNECGASDTTCITIQIGARDSLFITEQTCDSSSAGLFVNQYINISGCDSLVTREVYYTPGHFTEFVSTTCDSLSAGVDTSVYLNQYGCDSIIITRVDFTPSNETNLLLSTCDPQQAGMDTLHLVNQFGCDSTIFITYNLVPLYEVTEMIYICGSGTNYSDSLFVVSGNCDSLFITQFVYIPNDTTWVQKYSCDANQIGISQLILPSQWGCDSTIVTTTDLLPSHAVLIEGFTCNQSEVLFEENHLTNQYGCDSIVTIDIRYMGVDTQFVHISTCDPSQTEIVQQVLPGIYCDTVRVTETVLLPSSQSIQQIVRCQTTGPVADTLTLVNYLGCDSLAIRSYQYVDLQLDVEVFDVRCTGLSDGVIQIYYLSGGQPPLQYRLDQGPWQSSPLFENLAPGSHTVYVQENGGCLDTLSGLVVGEGLTLILEAGPDHLVNVGSFVKLELNANLPLDQIQWSATNTLSCPTCVATTLGPVQQEQTVLLTATTADGCHATDALEVRLLPITQVYIPNSFSPNGDGINDVFSIYGNEGVVAVRNLAIYDRWGNALYSRADLPVNDPSAGWEGDFRDKAMDPGVYVYVVEVELQDGSIRLYKGDVTLVR